LRRNVPSKQWYSLTKTNGSVLKNRTTQSVQRVMVGLQGDVY